MEKFPLTKQGIQDATEFLKSIKDSFYKNLTAWEVLTKNGKTPSIIEILDTANKLSR